MLLGREGTRRIEVCFCFRMSRGGMEKMEGNDLKFIGMR